MIRRLWSWFQGVALEALILVVLVLFVFLMGVHLEKKRWEKRVAKWQTAAAAETQRLLEKNYTLRPILVQKVVKTEKVYEIVERMVEVHVPADPIDRSFRVLHDAAAGNYDPPAAIGGDVAPTDAKTVASTVNANYATYYVQKAKLEALQAYVANLPTSCLAPGVRP
jgi:hypothetical protein